MKDEAWLKRIKDNLQDYSEPLPKGGWERLESELPRRKVIPLRRWIMAAAMLAGMAFLGLRLANRGSADLPSSMLPSNTTPLTADVLPVPPSPEPSLPAPLSVSRPTGISVLPPGKELKPDVSLEIEPKTAQTKEEKRKPEEKKKEGKGEKEEKGKKKATALPDNTNQLLLAMADKNRARSKGWSVGLSVGNTGSLSNGAGSEGNRYFQQNAPEFGNLSLDLSATSDGVLTIPKEQELIFQNGLPYLQSRSRRVASVDHKQPVSAGFSVRKNLPKGFSIETGLVYTFLSSDLFYEGEVEKTSQKLHYLGIPLRANWNFIDRKRFTLYVSAGGTVEKCIYGKIGKETVTVDPLQWSVMAAVGAQYNLGPRIGIYVEPGISYFFDDGSEVRTIRKDTPCNFTLQAGLRLSY